MSELMAAGLQLMMVGMGTVFFFLTVLVFATMLMSHLLGRFAPPPVIATTDSSPSADQRNEEVAAIAAAMHQHRSNSRNC